MPSNSAEPALRSARSAAYGAALQEKNRGAKRADAEPGHRERAALVQAGHGERQHGGDEPTRGDHHDDRPGLEQDGRQCGRFRCHDHNVADYGSVRNGVEFPRLSRDVLGTLCFVKDAEARLASDLSLAVIRLARQLRFRRPDSPVSLSQLSALSTLAKEGPMTPGALATRERVRPPSMTRVIASLAELGFVARDAHPADGRQVLVSVSRSGTELIKAERRASQEWLKQRLDCLEPDQRNTLLVAADLMSGIVDESA
jgi:DNA-binding MarR family transcriptional regulator